MTRTIVAMAVAGFVGHAVSASAQSTPTFSKDVAPILYKNCANCHRAGEIGPMPLLSYKDARPYARAIATAVQKGTMPPWHADDPTHSRFANDRSLSDADKNVLVAWASGGAPEGNPKDLPALPQFAEGWMMGKPDAVFTMQEDYPIPASGTLDYKFFEIPTNLTEDRWLQAFEVRPGARTARPPRDRLRAAWRRGAARRRRPAAAPAGAPRPTPPFSFGEGMRRPTDAPKPDRAPVENDRAAKRNPGAGSPGTHRDIRCASTSRAPRSRFPRARSSPSRCTTRPMARRRPIAPASG